MDRLIMDGVVYVTLAGLGLPNDEFIDRPTPEAFIPKRKRGETPTDPGYPYGAGVYRLDHVDDIRERTLQNAEQARQRHEKHVEQLRVDEEATKRRQLAAEEELKACIGAPSQLRAPIWCCKYNGYFYPTIFIPRDLILALGQADFSMPYTTQYGLKGRFWGLQRVQAALSISGHPEHL